MEAETAEHAGKSWPFVGRSSIKRRGSYLGTPVTVGRPKRTETKPERGPGTRCGALALGPGALSEVPGKACAGQWALPLQGLLRSPWTFVKQEI